MAAAKTSAAADPLQEYKPKLKVDGLCKTFIGKYGKVEALQNVSMQVDEGELVCVLGPSGCGKTTLLNIVAEFDNPDSGTVEVSNSQNPNAPQKLVIFQEPSLFPWLNVTENVQFGLRMLGIKASVRSEISEKYLTLVGLRKFARSYVHELSGGMKQRVALARALAMDPEILLMDEPFAALDPQTRRTLHTELLRLASETRKTILFITHNIDEALFLADRILVFASNPGRVKKEFNIHHSKPRDLESPIMRSMMADILKELCSEGVCPVGVNN